jgi:hypothetical protein
MNFQDLHELLRLELLRRIEHGDLSGTSLARQAGFQQAHISNFLNRKRAISLKGLDRVLAAQNLTVEQITPIELNASSTLPTTDPNEAIPVVSSSTAIDDAQVCPGAVIETIHISASWLQGNRSQPSLKRAHWQRFIAVRSD